MGSLGSWSVLFLILLVSIYQGDVSAEGSHNFYPDAPPVKTIKTKYGDQIDCVNISSQPAFGFPFLRGHKLMMQPSSFPVDMLKGVPLASNLTACKLSLGGNETCPQGTVPIFRGPKDTNMVTKSRLILAGLKDSGYVVEYASVTLAGGKFYGSLADLNIWNPSVDKQRTGFSQANLWVASDPSGNNAVEAGWQVFPEIHSGDRRTRLYIMWTRDGYKKTVCYNLNCPGFVQVSSKVAPGMVLPVSKYKGQQCSMRLLIYKDPKAGHWWLRIHKEWIGYWPKTIFTTLPNGASILEWGGLIFSEGTSLPAIQMGSGHFPIEGEEGISAYYHNLNYLDQKYKVKKPSASKSQCLASRPKCYDIKCLGDLGGNKGYTFFFGGPGRNNSQCH